MSALTGKADISQCLTWGDFKTLTKVDTSSQLTLGYPLLRDVTPLHSSGNKSN